MKTLSRIFLFTAFISSMSINAQNKLDFETSYIKIDTFLTNALNKGFSGAILVAQNDEIIINKGYGLADKTKQTFNNPNTIFDIGSNTKQFTAAAVLKLAEQGKIELSETLDKFFVNIPTDKKQITVHQLLSHSSGLVEVIGRDFQDITPEAYFEKLFATELLFEPGTSYSYSNAGYTLLSEIIEQRSEMTYEEYMQKYLFEPAGMNQTGYILPEWNTFEMARGYYRNVLDIGTTISRYKDANEINMHLKGNGGINATQNDLFLWHRALKDTVVLSKKSFELLTSPHIDRPTSSSSYAYGWVVKEAHNSMRISHNGSNGIFAHTILWHLEDDIFISYATNANSPSVEYLAYAVEKMLLDEHHIQAPVKDNVYNFTLNFTKGHSTEKSDELFSILNKDFSSEFNSSAILNRLGNVLLKENSHLNWAVKLFEKNVELYPEDGNLWDSLGDSFTAIQDKEQAIKSYKKAIALGYNGSQKKLDDLMSSQ